MAGCPAPREPPRRFDARAFDGPVEQFRCRDRHCEREARRQEASRERGAPECHISEMDRQHVEQIGAI